MRPISITFHMDVDLPKRERLHLPDLLRENLGFADVDIEYRLVICCGLQAKGISVPEHLGSQNSFSAEGFVAMDPIIEFIRDSQLRTPSQLQSENITLMNPDFSFGDDHSVTEPSTL